MIVLEKVSKRFADGTIALDDISLAIPQGAVFGIIGRSGAGKSTLLRLFNGLERASAGVVRVDGQSLEESGTAGLRAVRRRVGMIFQSFGLLANRTVAGNVALPLELAGISAGERRARVAELLERVGLADKAGLYPAHLSGGQRQRIGIARALATRPDVLLCDEATSALDPETTRAVLTLLGDLNRDLGLTIVLITHEMSVVRGLHACGGARPRARGRKRHGRRGARRRPSCRDARAAGGCGVSGLFAHVMWGDVAIATRDTLVMLAASLLLTILFGVPLGVLLFLTDRGQLAERAWLNRLAGVVVNVLRSIPFVILLIVMIPVTLQIVGTSLGGAGAIPPLVVAAAPFYARLVEQALREVPRATIEAAQAMGATRWQIVTKALLPEALPGLVSGATVAAVALVSFTAMAGVVGAGGLGDLAIRYGYQRFQTDVMLVTVVLMVVLVQLLQYVGDQLARRLDHR